MHSSLADIRAMPVEEQQQKIVVIEDETDIADLVAYNLEREGLAVTVVNRGDEALDVIRSVKPDLILMDLMLPGLDGLTICQQVRRSPLTAGIPVIMVSAKTEESDVVIGLGLGADDYIQKPFSIRELVARVKVALRKSAQSKPAENKRLRYDELTIDATRHEVLVSDMPVKLTATEFKILYQLAANPHKVFSREQLINSSLGQNTVIVDRNVDVHIRAVRKKLGTAATMIETIRGIGYRFSP